MKSYASLVLIAALLAAAPLAPLKADPVGPLSPSSATMSATKAPSTLTLDFPGGTLGELIAMVQ
jgi:hypothetical protein